MIDSNELTRKIKTPLNPKAALIAYASENDRNFFLEIREIDDRGNMTEGRPVTLEFMNTLVKGYSERHSTQKKPAIMICKFAPLYYATYSKPNRHI